MSLSMQQFQEAYNESVSERKKQNNDEQDFSLMFSLTSIKNSFFFFFSARSIFTLGLHFETVSAR